MCGPNRSDGGLGSSRGLEFDGCIRLVLVSLVAVCQAFLPIRTIENGAAGGKTIGDESEDTVGVSDVRGL